MEAQHLYNFAQFGQDVPIENNEVDPNGKSLFFYIIQMQFWKPAQLQYSFFIYHNILNCAIFFIDASCNTHTSRFNFDLNLIVAYDLIKEFSRKLILLKLIFLNFLPIN